MTVQIAIPSAPPPTAAVPTAVLPAAEIEAALRAARDELGLRFEGAGTMGYGNRALLFLAEDAVLKLYVGIRPGTGFWEQRLARERTGLRLAAGLAGMDVPVFLGHGGAPGTPCWIAYSRLRGGKADEESPDDVAVTDALAFAAARLHSLPIPGRELPPFRRVVRDLDPARPDAHVGRARLTAALAAAEPAARRACVSGVVHGDYSSHNVLIGAGRRPGVLDFEGCGVGCVYEDLATLVIQDGLLGGRGEQPLVAAYARFAAEHGAPAPDRGHLYFHVAYYLRWVLQWAVDYDKQLAWRFSALIPKVLGVLDEAGAAGAAAQGAAGCPGGFDPSSRAR